MAEFNGTGSANTYGGTSEDDLIKGLAGNDDLAGAGGNDTIFGGDDEDTLAGGEGDDYIVGGLGYDVIYGNDGDDYFGINPRVYTESNGDIVNGGEGDDTLSFFFSNEYTYIPSSVATSGGDYMYDGNSTLYVSNVEFIEVWGTNQIITPGTATYLTYTDTVYANYGESKIDPEYYDGLKITTNYFDADGTKGLRVEGDEIYHDDTFDTNLGEVTARYYGGSNGYWTFDLTLPDELFYGVAYYTDFILDETIDITFIDYANTKFTTPITFGYSLNANVYASGANSVVSFAGDDQDSYITLGNSDDAVSGGDGDDTVYAGDGDDTIFAGATDTGDDTFYGQGGNDILGGGAGDDYIRGGNGNDTIFGGMNDDTVFGEDNNDVIWAGDGIDYVYAGSGNDIVGGGIGVDDLNGGDGDDTFYAGDDDDVVVGDAGDDILYGGSGNDLLEGREDDDLIYNGAGDDEVYGGSGDDTLWGGPGDDTLFGGTGDDTFAFTATSGNDVVEDFEFDDDILDLSSFVATLADPASIDYSDIIDEMTNSGSDVILALTPGNTVTFTDLSITDFLTATPDWAVFF